METGERIFVSGEGRVCIDTDYCMVEVMFAVIGGMDLGDGGVISAFIIVAVDVVGMDGDVVRCTDSESKPVLAMAGITGRLCKLQWNEYARFRIVVGVKTVILVSEVIEVFPIGYFLQECDAVLT